MADKTVKFSIELQDKITGPLKSIQVAADKLNLTFTSIQKNISKIASALSVFGNNSTSSINRVTYSTSQLNKELDKVSNKRKINIDSNDLNRSSFGGRGGGIGVGGIAMGGMLGNLAASAVTSAGRGIKELISESMTAGMEGSKTATQFNVMAGSQGDVLYKDLTKYISDSIYGTELYKNANMLLNYGEKAPNVMGDIKMLGDIAGGDKQRLEGLTRAFSQTLSMGKLQGQDKNQMVAAGFNPLQEMARTTGKSMKQLTKDMEDGKISFEMVRKAFEDATKEGGKFHGMLDRISKTAFGQTEAMKGNIDMLKMKFGQMMEPAIVRVLKVMNDNLDKFGKNMAELQPYINKVADVLVAKLPGLFDSIWETAKILPDIFDTALELGKSFIDLFRDSMKFIAAHKEQIKILISHTDDMIKLYLAIKAAGMVMGMISFVKDIRALFILMGEQTLIINTLKGAFAILTPEILAITAALGVLFGTAYGLAHEDEYKKNKYGIEGTSRDAKNVSEAIALKDIRVQTELDKKLGAPKKLTDEQNKKIFEEINKNTNKTASALKEYKTEPEKHKHAAVDKQFNITINGGLIGKSEINVDNSKNAPKYTQEEIEAAVIRGITEALNALPSYNQ